VQGGEGDRSILTGSGATSKGPRRLALLVIAVVAFGAYALSPAIGGPSQLTLKRAKELFFTKLQSNTRFYSKAVADARFLPRQRGEYEFTIDPYEWQGIGRVAQPGFVSFSGSGTEQMTLHEGNLPSRFAGKGLRLSGIELCIEPNDASVSHFTIERSGPVTGDPVPDPITFYNQDEDISSAACHRFLAPAAAVDSAGMIDLTASITYDGTGTVEFGRTTAIFVP
jgi:hypothetical protein